MRADSSLSYEQANRLLRLDPETGKLFWLPRPVALFKCSSDRRAQASARRWNESLAGTEAFTTIDFYGYPKGSIFGRLYFAHRIVWLLHYRSHAVGEIDHINGIRDDNRVSNLRDVTPSQNQRNMKLRSDNTSGFCGVRLRKDTCRWEAYVHIGGKRRILGMFSDFEEAVEARKQANSLHGFTDRHGNKPDRPAELF